MARCDGIVCCLGCMALVPGLQERVVSRMAFAPPPSSYRLACGKTFIKNAVGEEMEVPKRACVKKEDPDIYIDSLCLATNMGHEIPAFHFCHPKAKTTMIFSHGNSTDIGYMFPHLLDLCIILGVNVFAYEYSGYGYSTGEPSEPAIYADIEAAYDHVVKRQEIPPSRVLLYGQSVGSAASIELAAKRPVGGLVVHSGIKSGLTALRSEYDQIHWFDAFKNLEKIRQVTCPVFVIHGSGDSEVKVDHGKALFDAAATRTKQSWWVCGAGHNDIETVCRRSYFQKILSFMRSAGLGVSPAAAVGWCDAPSQTSTSCHGSSSRSPHRSTSATAPVMTDKGDMPSYADNTYVENGILWCSSGRSPRRKKHIAAHPRASHFKTKADVERRHGRCRMPLSHSVSPSIAADSTPSATCEDLRQTAPAFSVSLLSHGLNSIEHALRRGSSGSTATASTGISDLASRWLRGGGRCATAPTTSSGFPHSSKPLPPLKPEYCRPRQATSFESQTTGEDGSSLPALPSLCHSIESRFFSGP